MKTLSFLSNPVAIAMWDFSWLERRWPGAGYENWSLVLDELAGRGYNAVRIDPFPHLCAADPSKLWELLPPWNQNSWGSPALNRVQIQPALNEFIAACAERSIRVGLSSWWRQDRDDTRLGIVSPSRQAGAWIKTLGQIQAAGLLDAILYVDLANEWPLAAWSPFFQNSAPHGDTDWQSPGALAWMREAIGHCRAEYPQLDYCFSTCTHLADYQRADVSFLDVLEPHIWMATSSDFYRRVGYHFEPFSPAGFEKVAARAEPLYRQNPAHWQHELRAAIHEAARGARACRRRLVTTEGWAVVDYKDWPLLDWGWVKELCALGVEEAMATQCWVGMATSNFCGPQFAGMWRDISWHQRLTARIRAAGVRDWAKGGQE